MSRYFKFLIILSVLFAAIYFYQRNVSSSETNSDFGATPEKTNSNYSALLVTKPHPFSNHSSESPKDTEGVLSEVSDGTILKRSRIVQQDELNNVFRFNGEDLGD